MGGVKTRSSNADSGGESQEIVFNRLDSRSDESSMRLQQEAHALVDVFTSSDGRDRLLGFLSGQLGVVKLQAQQLLGLCGLTITVTGFSGAHLIRGGWLSSWLLVAGIGLILIAVVLLLRALMVLRWVSEDVRPSATETAARVIARRNRQQRAVLVAGVFVTSGLAAYLGAVAIAAVAHVGPAHP